MIHCKNNIFSWLRVSSVLLVCALICCALCGCGTAADETDEAVKLKDLYGLFDPVPMNVNRDSDLDGDGVKETLFSDYCYDEEDQPIGFMLFVREQNGERFIYEKLQGEFICMYVVDIDSTDELVEIVVSFEETGINYTTVMRYTPEGVFDELATLEGVCSGCYEGAITLERPVRIPGSWLGDVAWKLTDGRELSYVGWWEVDINDYDKSQYAKLTASTVMHTDDGDVTLPAGTGILPTRTDEQTIMYVVTDDGKNGWFDLECDADGNIFINGVALAQLI